MKEVTAQTFLEVMVTCPECGAVDDVLEEVRESLDYGELSTSKCEIEYRCSECNTEFYITKVIY